MFKPWASKSPTKINRISFSLDLEENRLNIFASLQLIKRRRIRISSLENSFTREIITNPLQCLFVRREQLSVITS
jgi:hypothetical protein